MLIKLTKIFFVLFFFGIISGCAYSSNQKIAASLVGFNKNQYIIINVANEEDLKSITNLLKRTTIETNQTKTINIPFKGNDVFAIENQILIGRDIANNTSNDVHGSLSLPLIK